ncbi:MAG: glycosyltransferase family 2 protein, partial [Actinomycetota bacterium]|nr:glycosyltransferase family 2 protein [Actinomycetota bacterium]
MGQPGPRPDPAIARVRVVVVNFNRGRLTLDCLESLKQLEWPADRLDVVVVDNASSDGSAEAIRQAHPWARVITSAENLGFAGGNNLALRDLSDLDYVALVNNDATVDPGWLAPLVAALEQDPGIGAACSKVLFAGRFVELALSSQTTRASRCDTRRLGLQVSGIEVDGTDHWAGAQFVEGWWGQEFGPGGTFQWSTDSARLRVPAGQEARLRLSAARPVRARVDSGGGATSVAVGPEPTWVTVPLAAEPIEVVNNAGNRLLAAGFCADRGYLEPDQGQYQVAAEVFAWCGASVLLRPGYLADIGLFDERLFLYYEDFDLSWQGRLQGWRYRYVPGSVVHHVHSATAGQASAVTAYHVERNRLLVLAKNAPARLAAAAAFRFLVVTASYLRRDLVCPLLGGQRPRPAVPIRRLR